MAETVTTWRYKARGSCVIVRSAVKRDPSNNEYNEDDNHRVKQETASTLIHDETRGLMIIPKNTTDTSNTEPKPKHNLKTKHMRDLVKQTDALKEDTKQFCLFWSAHNDHLDTSALRENIVRDLLNREKFPTEMTFSTANFPADELTRSRFIAVYRLIDFYFFNTVSLCNTPPIFHISMDRNEQIISLVSLSLSLLCSRILLLSDIGSRTTASGQRERIQIIRLCGA